MLKLTGVPLTTTAKAVPEPVVGWSKTLSSEVAADGVTVNILVPGRIDTERVRLTQRLHAFAAGLACVGRPPL